VRRTLFAAQLVVTLLIARNWAYVTTYRLYLERRTEAAPHSAAVQQFEVEGPRVVPHITTRGADRLAFAHRIDQDSTIRTELRPAASANYTVTWRDGSTERTLAAGRADRPTPIACDFPTGNGVVELASDGPVTWVDPRIVRGFRVWPHLALLALLAAASIAWPGGTRVAWFRVAAASGSALLALLAAEGALRAAGDRLPAGVASERHDLGELTRDTRWEPSARYGRRLRAHVDATNEWRHGDIVRMGFIPPSVSPGTLHRFRFVTDAEGFRNAAVRERYDIAAVGDSFTDAMTMEADASWPAQLERRLGVAVQNYGTAGFGPLQEQRVVEDYVAPRRPAIVVLAYFAGNDLFDAEAFEAMQRSHEPIAPSDAGWRVKEVFSRADTWFLVSAVRAGAAWAARAQPSTRAEAATIDMAPVGARRQGPGFDRGMFTADVAGHPISWAFMPPYLNTLNFSERELRERRGWALTRDAIAAMQRTTASFGGRFVVMFLPFKSQVYLPLVERALPRATVDAALHFYLDGSQRPIDIAAMRRNRLAQNRMMRELCERLQIPFVDTTGALQARLESGENVYFPDESHLNEAGEAVVADALAAFLTDRFAGLISSR